MSILSRLQEGLKGTSGRSASRTETKTVLSPRLRNRIQQRVNGYGKRWDPIAVAVKGETRLFYFRSDWARKEKARRRAASKVSKQSRKVNR